MYMRRLVKSGLSSHVVALPKEFLVDNKLHRGDLLYLERQGRTHLLVSIGAKGKEHRERKIKVKEIDAGSRPLHHIQREIIEAYVKNYNEVVIKLSNPSQAKIIKQYISYLVAFEVVQEDNKKIVARDFLNYRDTEIDRSMRRTEHIVHSMLMDLQEIEKNNSNVDAIFERDQEVNRTAYLIMRILQVAATDPEIMEILKLDSLRIIQLWAINMHLEKIGDETKRIARHLPELFTLKQNKKKFYELLHAIIALYQDTFKAIHTQDVALTDTNLDRRQEILLLTDKYEDENHTLVTSRIMGFFKQILSHLADVNRSYRYIGM